MAMQRKPDHNMISHRAGRGTRDHLPNHSCRSYVLLMRESPTPPQTLHKWILMAGLHDMGAAARAVQAKLWRQHPSRDAAQGAFLLALCPLPPSMTAHRSPLMSAQLYPDGVGGVAKTAPLSRGGDVLYTSSCHSSAEQTA